MAARLALARLRRARPQLGLPWAAEHAARRLLRRATSLADLSRPELDEPAQSTKAPLSATASAMSQSLDSSAGVELSFEESFRHFSFTNSTDTEVKEMADLVFKEMCSEAAEMAKSPIGFEVATRCVLDRTCLVDAVSTTLAAKLSLQHLPTRRSEGHHQPHAPDFTSGQEAYLRDTIRETISRPHVLRAVVADIVKSFLVDPSADGLLQPALFFKGFHAITTYRVAHALWTQGDATNCSIGHLLQSRASDLFGVDIHPPEVASKHAAAVQAARIGNGVMFDHATGIVVGGTAIMASRPYRACQCNPTPLQGNDLYVLHGVTLGATGKHTLGGKRHPTIGSRVVLGAGCTILGDIKVGDGCVIGAGAMVTKNVPAGGTVVGVNKIILKPEFEESSHFVYGHDYRMSVRGLHKDDWEMQWVP